MKSVNRVTLIGNVGQDPEVRSLPNGGKVANFNMATSESWTDKESGEIKERTEWHKICIFGPQAEVAEKYVKKGTQIYIDGQLQTRKWQDQNGSDRWTTEIIVTLGGTMMMLGRGERQENE